MTPSRSFNIVVFVLVAFLAVVAPAFSQESGMLEIQNNTPYALPSSTLVGHSNSDAVIDVVIGLKWQKEQDLDDLLVNQQDSTSPEYQRFLSPGEFTNRFAPTQADTDGLTRYLESQGLVVMQVASDRKLVHVKGAVFQLEQAFHLSINNYALDGTRYFANDRNPSLPSEVGVAVESVVGLSSLETFHANSHARPGTERQSSGVIYTPSQLATAYNFPNSNNTSHGTAYDGTGVTIAVATAFAYTQSDLNFFWSYYGISRTGSLTVVPVNGGSTTPNLEPTVDVENVGAQATGANLLVYETPDSSFASFNLMYGQIASDNLAQVLSVSWVACESSIGASLQTMEAIFKRMSAQGMTMFVGSGDNGAYACSATSPTLAVDFPSSSPYFTAVGGTNLYLQSNGQYSSETAWTGSGGGISSKFAKPSWQVGPGVPTNKRRDVADVSFDASSHTAIYTYYQGVLEGAYGTSFGGPNWAALWALAIQSKSGVRTGNANPTVYKIGASASYHQNFHDVTTGNNGNGIGPGYNAKKNWDFPTGWGSPNGTNLVNYVKTH